MKGRILTVKISVTLGWGVFLNFVHSSKTLGPFMHNPAVSTLMASTLSCAGLLDSEKHIAENRKPSVEGKGNGVDCAAAV